MRTFFVIWCGQLVSMIGSYMTVFAVILWVWERTGSASALTVISFFSILPRIPMSFIAGGIVDRWNRKTLMIIGDLNAALCTAAIGLLYGSDRLQIWHFWVAVAIHACCSQLQQLAYISAIAQVVPQQHHIRANSLNSAIRFAGVIVAPALAGVLYPIIGLGGMVGLDLLTFGVALGTLLVVQVPPLPHADKGGSDRPPLWQALGFGIRYIYQDSGLTAMVITYTLFAIANDLGQALYNPLMLARTGGDAQLLGIVTAAGGVGGLLGAIILSLWGGFQSRIHGMLLGFIGAGVARLLFSLGQSESLWITAQFLAALHTPLFISSATAIWYARVPLQMQGRVLAVDQLIGLIVGSIATLIAGPLAETIFEPALQTDRLQPGFRIIFGTENGAGIALLFALTALWMIAVGLGGYRYAKLRFVEADKPP